MLTRSKSKTPAETAVQPQGEDTMPDTIEAPTDMQTILAHLEHMHERITAMEARHNQQEEDRNMTQHEQEQRSSTPAMETDTPSTKTTTTTMTNTHPSFHEPKVGEPSKFGGKQSEFLSFITQCDAIFRMCAYSYPNDEYKVLFIITHLEGNALRWARDILANDEHPYRKDYKAFRSALFSLYDNHTYHQDAEDKLMSLKQTKSASAYAVEFQTLSASLNWNEEALCGRFFWGLKSTVKDAIMQQGRARKFDELRDQAVRFDQHQHRMRVEEQNRERPQAPGNRMQYPSTPIRPPRYSTPTNHGNLPQKRRFPPSSEERERRRALHLCFRCGGEGHTLNECPRKRRQGVVNAAPWRGQTRSRSHTPAPTPTHRPLTAPPTDTHNPVKLAVSTLAGVRALRHAQLTSISDTAPDLMRLPVTIPRYPTPISGLIDCGASLNFLHEDLVAQLKIDTRPCTPINVTVVDGRPLPPIRQQVTLVFNAPETYRETFYIAPIGIHHMILGMPWLTHANPVIDWKTRTVKPRLGQEPPTPPRTPDTQSTPEPSHRIYTILAPNSRKRKKPKKKSKKRSKKKSKKSVKPTGSPTTPTPTVSLTTGIHPTDQVYLIHVTPNHQLDAVATSMGEGQVQIPPEYQDLAEVFSETRANTLPPHRGQLDHPITLEEGAKPTYGPIYNLSETELSVLKSYIEEHIEKGFIRPSTSPFGAPVLFVKKADGSLRLCVDYRALNRMTIKNRYPLPLIAELLDRIVGAKYFTKIDLRSAYNLIRIALGDEWKTAFRTRYGHFEYLVMPFGLTNAPATFQSYINEAIREYLDEFCVAYLDDILIYSNSLEEHTGHVHKVLEKLLKHGLYAKLEKCQFHVQEIEFLGYVLSPTGVTISQKRIATILEWPVPKSIHDIQVFLGFTNFYRRFVENYSGVVTPITNLLRKNNKFEWSDDVQRAFEKLKSLFSNEPLLRHFNPELPIQLHTDSSGFAICGIISQLSDDRWHPVAYWSRKCTPAECNYDIHDREMLAIISAMKNWRHYLEGARHPVRILTDHKNLEIFMSTKILNRRQARWAELLADYDFVFEHIPGKKNPADGPSRRPDYAENAEELPAGTLFPKSAFRCLAATAARIQHTPTNDLRKRLIEALANDTVAQQHKKDISTQQNDVNAQQQHTQKQLWSCDNGLLLRNNLIYIPENDALRLEIMRMHHDDALAGHYSAVKTLDLLSRNYWFPGMSTYVKKYVETCNVCARGKAPRHLPHGELAPLPAPAGPWKGISCDFIVDLPKSHGYDSILVFIDRLTKMSHLIPCTKTATAPDFARMYMDYIIRLHGLPDSIVSDRGAIFTSRFWKSLANMMGTRQRLSTAFHPQTDGQTERMNQTVEQYLRMYCNYQQDNWAGLLSLAEFSYNNAYQQTIKCSPFYANYGYNPRFTVDPRTTNTTLPTPAAAALADKLKVLHEDLIEAIKVVQNYQAQYYDTKHKPITFQKGDRVWLRSVNIRTERQSRKLDWKRIGPFTITECIGTQAYRLELPKSMKIHPVFHVILLEPYKQSQIPGRTQEPPPPVIIEDIAQYEVEEILDSKVSRRRLLYLVKWKGYPDSENSWEMVANVKNAPLLIARFHTRYPEKPKSV